MFLNMLLTFNIIRKLMSCIFFFIILHLLLHTLIRSSTLTPNPNNNNCFVIPFTTYASIISSTCSNQPFILHMQAFVYKGITKTSTVESFLFVRVNVNFSGSLGHYFVGIVAGRNVINTKQMLVYIYVYVRRNVNS